MQYTYFKKWHCYKFWKHNLLGWAVITIFWEFLEKKRFCVLLNEIFPGNFFQNFCTSSILYSNPWNRTKFYMQYTYFKRWHWYNFWKHNLLGWALITSFWEFSEKKRSCVLLNEIFPGNLRGELYDFVKIFGGFYWKK